MGWKSNTSLPKPSKPNHATLPPEEHRIFTIINQNTPMHIDKIQGLSKMNHGQLAIIILNLELGHWIVSLPGNYYKAL
jgi:predicted Rossmann fold nucleotide-binding protein DprA/Smf involved in DNA uptake